MSILDDRLVAFAAAIKTRFDALNTDALFVPGDQSHVAGSRMRVDYIHDDDSAFNTKTLGGLWASGTGAHLLSSMRFDTAYLSDDNNATIGGGPLFHRLLFTEQAGAEGDVVGVGNVMYASANNQTMFGGNTVLFSAAGITGVKAVGWEWDLQLSAPAAAGSNLLIANAFNYAHNAAIFLAGGVSGGSWANGFGTSSIRGSHHYVPTGDPVTSNTFIDTTNATTFNTAAILLGSGVGHALKWTGGAKLYYDGANQRQVLPTGGVWAIRDSADLNSLFTFDGTGGLAMPSGGTIKINGLQIITSRVTGWTAMAGSTDKASAFDPSTVTLSQLAARVSSIQAALTSHGMIGT